MTEPPVHSTPSSPSTPLNVLIYMSDEHNPFVSSVYGHPLVETPNMARLAATGVVFDAAYCPSPLCAPSRAAFLAGLPVHRLGVYNNCTVVRFDYPSYGGVLREQSVHTVYAGKMDAYNRSDTIGFSELIRSGDRDGSGDTNFRREPLAIRADAVKRASGYGVRDDPFGEDTLIVDDAIDWLRHRAPHLDGPWTLTVNTGPPHFPHYVTQELWDKYAAGADLPAHGRDEATAAHPYARDLRAHFRTEEFTEEQIRGLRRGYLGGVEWVDRQLGRILDALDTTGQRENTVVVYTSDHGEMLGTFGMWWKCSLYEDSARVPLIAAGPGYTPGTRVSTPVTLLDLQAAMFHALGKDRPADWWGTPLQAIPPNDESRAAFAEYHGHGVRSGAFMVRKGPWKLLYNMAAPHQLFNVAVDPHELDDRAEAEPAVFADLEAELRRFCDPEAENEGAFAMEHRQLALLATHSMSVGEPFAGQDRAAPR